MREYLSLKDFSITFTHLLLLIEKSTLKFCFKKKRLEVRVPVGPNLRPPLHLPSGEFKKKSDINLSKKGFDLWSPDSYIINTK